MVRTKQLAQETRMTDSKMSKTVEELAAHLNAEFTGDGHVEISRIASLEAADPGSVSFVNDPKALDQAADCLASCLIVADVDSARRAFPSVAAFIAAPQPKLAFAQVGKLLHPNKRREPSIHSTAVIAETADVDLTVYIGPHVTIGERTRVAGGTRIEANVVIGDDVSIGSDCILHPTVVVYDNVTVGNGVTLHAGVCLGADGFGYVRDDMDYHKFPQVGMVVIEDDVELGSQTCIDRAALGQTRIGRGTKIDNMVHVGHNCDIGQRVIIAAQTGISGSVTIEDDVVIGGQVGFGDHIHVRSGAVIGSKAGILPGKIVRPGVWWGIPIQPLDEYKKLNAHLRHLPEIREEIKRVKARLEELEKSSS
jgi:UDP-3-O-[3-hydroxymyristoyl] glucosamine N-acyltransferase